MSKDRQFGHTVTSDYCEVTMGGRIRCPLAISSCQNTSKYLVLHMTTPTAKYICSACPLQQPRCSMLHSCMTHKLNDKQDAKTFSLFSCLGMYRNRDFSVLTFSQRSNRGLRYAGTHSFETSGTTYPATQRHIPGSSESQKTEGFLVMRIQWTLPSIIDE